tara:strand:- start:4041 stop:6353 length:2313 start_codon:yes stop_codon:yes gene_type:complete
MASIDDLVKAANTKRVQVADLADAPKLQATIQSGGQYNVAVQKAGSNKMLDLADALSKINPMLRDATSVMRMRREDQTLEGEKQASLISDAEIYDELKKTDPGTWRTAIRNKAFTNTLLKRAINNDLLPSMRAESDVLLDLDKHKNSESLLSGTDDFLKAKWEDFSALVGEDAAKSEGARALWNAVTGPFKADMLAAYDKKKDDFIADGQADEYSIQLNDITQRRVDAEGKALPLDVVGFKQIIKGREELMKQSGITDKATRNSIIISETATRVKTLIIEGRLDDADNMLNAMEGTVIGGRRMFNTGEARRVTNQLYADLVSARNSASTRSIASQKQEFTGRWTTNLLSLNSFDTGAEVPDQVWTGVRQTLGMLSMKEADIEAIISELQASNDLSTDYEKALQLRSHTFGDDAAQVYFGSAKPRREILSTLGLQKRNVTSPDEQDEQVAAYTEWAKNNDGTVEEWKATLGKDGHFETHPPLKKAQAEALQGGFVKDVPAYRSVSSDFKNRVSELAKDLRKSKQGVMTSLFDEYQRGMVSYIERELRTRGKEKFNTFENKEDRIADITDQQQFLIQQQIDRLQGIFDAQTNILRPEGQVNPLTDKFEADSLPKSKRQSMEAASGIDKGFWSDTIIYPSLAAIEDLEQSGGVTPADIMKDRQKMIEANQKGHLSRSLYNYGFPNGFSERNAELLEKSGLDVDDVRLFSSVTELSEKVEEWRPVVKKYFDNETLNEEETALRKQYVPYGIFSENDLDDFKWAQFNLFKNRDQL